MCVAVLIYYLRYTKLFVRLRCSFSKFRARRRRYQEIEGDKWRFVIRGTTRSLLIGIKQPLFDKTVDFINNLFYSPQAQISDK